MKYFGLFFELHLPQNFCHTPTQTGKQIFSKNSQDIPKRVNSSKNRNKKLLQKQDFLSLVQKKLKQKKKKKKKKEKGNMRWNIIYPED